MDWDQLLDRIERVEALLRAIKPQIKRRALSGEDLCAASCILDAAYQVNELYNYNQNQKRKGGRS